MLKKKFFFKDDKYIFNKDSPKINFICEDLMQVDTVITNCSIVRHDGILDAGLAVEQGKVVAVAKDSELPPAKKTIDGKGNHEESSLTDVR